MGCGASTVSNPESTKPEADPAQQSLLGEDGPSQFSPSTELIFHGQEPLNEEQSEVESMAGREEESGLRTPVNLDTLPSPQCYGGVAATPTTTHTSSRFFCPLCLHYFPEILHTSCCQNYICVPCALGYIIEKTGPQNSRDIPPMPMEGVFCLFCQHDEVQFIPLTLSDEQAPRSYIESPYTKDLQQKMHKRQQHKSTIKRVPHSAFHDGSRWDDDQYTARPPSAEPNAIQKLVFDESDPRTSVSVSRSKADDNSNNSNNMEKHVILRVNTATMEPEPLYYATPLLYLHDILETGPTRAAPTVPSMQDSPNTPLALKKSYPSLTDQKYNKTRQTTDVTYNGSETDKLSKRTQTTRMPEDSDSQHVQNLDKEFGKQPEPMLTPDSPVTIQ